MRHIDLIKNTPPKSIWVRPEESEEERREVYKQTPRSELVHEPVARSRASYDAVSIQYAVLWVDLCVSNKEADENGLYKYTVYVTKKDAEIILIRAGIPLKTAVTYWKRQQAKAMSKFKRLLRLVLIQEMPELSSRKISGNKLKPITPEQKFFLLSRAEALDKDENMC